MTSTTTAAVQARRNLSGFAVFVGMGVGASVVSRVTGFGLACPWRSLTGTACPLCGSTHLGMSLLSGDVLGAWSANQFVFVMLVLVSVLAGLWSITALGGPALRLPGRWGQQSVWIATASIAGVAFMIARNVWFPLP